MVILSPAAVAAHDDAELDVWISEWVEATRIQGLTLTDLDTYTGMARRHLRYFGRVVPISPHTHPIRPRQVRVGDSVERWRSLVETYFRAVDVDRVLRIMQCESRGNPDAYHSGSGASGLMQHLKRYWATRSAAAGYAGASIFNPTANVAVAAWLRDQPGGFLHWVCR